MGSIVDSRPGFAGWGFHRERRVAQETEQIQFVEQEDIIAQGDMYLGYIEGWTDTDDKLHTYRGEILWSEISAYLENGSVLRSSERALSEKGLPSSEKERGTTRFRVLSFPRTAYNRWKIGFPESTYDQITAAWGLHKYTAETIVDNNGVTSSFDTSEKRCILMKVAAARSVGFDTLSLSHIRQEKVTNVMYYSLGDEMNVFDNLLAEPERCLQPTFFAAVLYRCHQQRLENYRKTLDRALIHIEERSKFGGPGRLFGREFGRSSRADDPGGDLTLKLSYMQTEIAIAGHLARACEKCGAGIAEIAERDESCVMNGVDVDDEKLHTYHTRGFDLDSASATSSEVQYVRRRAETVVSQLQGIQDRVQSQTTFLLNMAAINQSDYTAEIAFETRRDSAAMKTIAVLTIVFLPGTFVATILSMDMFQWQPDDGGPATVSRLFWVYWVITIPLTAIVLAGWLIWTRKSVGKLRRFGEGKVDRTQTESPTLRRAPTTSSAAYSSGTSIQS